MNKKPKASFIRLPSTTEDEQKKQELFVSTGTIETPKSLDGKTAESLSSAEKSKRFVLQRKSGKDVVKTSLYLEPSKARKFAMYCAAHGRKQNDVVNELLDQLLTNFEPQF